VSYIFLDTNALIKLYILEEKGSTWLKSFIVGKTVCISELALYESATTLARKFLAGKYTRDEVATIFTKLTRDILQYDVVSLSSDEQKERVFEIAKTFTSGATIRTLDVIQLAAAYTQLEVANNETPPQSFTFVTADKGLIGLAQARNFVVENPENYS
jgi:predicted nucleic acid-binding protein